MFGRRAFAAVRRARTDVEQADFAYRGGVGEELVEAFGAVGEVAVAVFAGVRQALDELFVLGEFGRGFGKAGAARLERAGDAHGEFVYRGFGVGVFGVEDFALFGEFDFALQGAGRLRGDGVVGGAAATADRAAAPVEEAGFDVVTAGDVEDGLLRAVELPGAGEDAAVFAAVGVAEHDFLGIVLVGEQGAVGGVVEQLRQDGVDVFQVFDGFKERRNRQGGVGAALFVLPGESGEAHQEQYFEDVAGAVGHGDDVAAEGARADEFAQAGDGAYQRQLFLGFGREVLFEEERRAGGGDELSERLLAAGFVQRVVVGQVGRVRKEVGDDVGVPGGFLADVERCHVEAAAAHKAD